METNNFNKRSTDIETDIEKVKQHLIYATIKFHSYNELKNFIKISSLGTNCIITGKTIDDAFEYMINIGKAIIYAIDLPKKVKESSEHCSESDFLAIKEKFKSLLQEVK